MNEEQKNRILGFILIFLLIIVSFVIFKYSHALKNTNQNLYVAKSGNTTNNKNPNTISIVTPFNNNQDIKTDETKTKAIEVKSENSLIDINTATQYELLNIPGIGPKTADAIIDYRNKTGKFKSLEDILNVTGIGKVKLENMRPYLSPLPFSKSNENSKTNSNLEMKICSYCNMPLKPNNSRIKSYKPYCTNCLKYLYEDEKK